MKKRGRLLAAFMLTIGLVTNALALEVIVGHVTLVEPTYLPGAVVLFMDSGSASCPVGRMLRWANSNIENNKAIYAALLVAITNGNQIRFYVSDGDTNCVGQFLHVLPST